MPRICIDLRMMNNCTSLHVSIITCVEIMGARKGGGKVGARPLDNSVKIVSLYGEVFLLFFSPYETLLLSLQKFLRAPMVDIITYNVRKM